MALGILTWPFRKYFDWLKRRGGLATHAKILPFGSAAGTYIVAKFICGGEWKFWNSWDAMVQSPSLGTIGYAFVMATLEAIIVVGIMAADYIKKSRIKTRQETVADLLAKAQTQEERDIIRRLASEQGIKLPLTPA